MSMNPRPINFVQQGVGERRRREIERVDDMTAKDTTVSGRHLISGLGELLFRADFPVTFAKRPVPSFGGELEEGEILVTGAFPRAEAVVSSWQIKGAIEGAFDGYYVGAWIACTTFGGSSLQKIWLNYSFHGVALRSPVNITEDIDDEI